MADRRVCGAEHPDKPGVYCERKVCVEYHRSGTEIWDNPRRMPPKKSDPVKMADVIRRTRARARGTDPGTPRAAAAAAGDMTQAPPARLETLAARSRAAD